MLLWLYGSVLEIDRADADVYKYFDDAVVLQSSVHESWAYFQDLFLGNEGEGLKAYTESMYNWEHAEESVMRSDNRTMIRIHSLLLFISGGAIMVHQIVFSLISFLGLIFLFKGMRTWYSMPGWAFLALCILPPSLLLWGSGLLKETLVMLPLGLAVYGLARMQLSVKYVLFVLLSALLFVFVKPYIGLCLLPGVIFLLIHRLVQRNMGIAALLAMAVVAMGLIASSYTEQFSIIEILSAKQAEFLDHAIQEDAGSRVELLPFNGFVEFITQGPSALFNTLCRPGIWEASGGLGILAGLENMAYLLLVVMVFWFRKKQGLSPGFYFSILTILSIGILVGSVTPVLGAVVRYKVPLLPFLIFALFHRIDFKKLPAPLCKLG